MKTILILKIGLNRLILGSVLLASILIQGCEKNENVEALLYNQTELLTKEAQVLKNSIIKERKAIQKISTETTMTKSGDYNTTIDIKTFNELNKKSLEMLNSYGFNYSDIDEFVENENDPRITLISMLFIAFLEENSDTSPAPRMKSGNVEEGWKNDDTCYSVQSVLGCIGMAALGVDISEGIMGLKCATATSALKLFGNAAAKAFGLAGAALAVASFGDCMGWYDIPGV